MQLRHALETELETWAGLDAAGNDDLLGDEVWDDEISGSDSVPGSDDEIAAAERWLEAHPLDDDEDWLDGQAIDVDLTYGLH